MRQASYTNAADMPGPRTVFLDGQELPDAQAPLDFTELWLYLFWSMFGTLGGEGWHIFLQDECMMLVEKSKKENNQKECGKDPTTKTCLEGPKISLPLCHIG